MTSIFDPEANLAANGPSSARLSVPPQFTLRWVLTAFLVLGAFRQPDGGQLSFSLPGSSPAGLFRASGDA